MLRLHVEQVGVFAVFDYQGLVCAAYHDAPVFQDVNAVGHVDGGEAVADKNGGAVAGQQPEIAEEADNSNPDDNNPKIVQSRERDLLLPKFMEPL